MSELVITPLPPESRVDCVRHACGFRRTGGGESFVLHYDVPPDLARPDEGDADSFLLAAVFLAMQEGRGLVIGGSVCRHLAENLEELALAWRLWNPKRYQSALRISADRWREPVAEKIREEGAVAAFSGGLDATHLIWSWLHPEGRIRNEPLRRVFFVHGFDIASGDPSFEEAYERGVETLASVGLKLDRIRTNFRDVLKLDWNECYGTAVASCLHFYRPSLTRGLIASGQPYDRLVIHGSSPVVDVLFSSHDFRVSHHGAAYDRTEKLEQILGWKEGAENLRVCWQPEGRGANCGVCEKCVRTKLNFWAAGGEAPASLGAPLEPSDVSGMVIRSEVLRSEIAQILLRAREKGLSGPILSALEGRVARPVDRKKKRRLRRWLDKLR